MARTAKIMLNNSDKSGHPCLVPDLKGNVFSFSPLRMIYAVFLYICIYFHYIHVYIYLFIIMMRQIPAMPTFWRLCIINGY